MIIQKRLLKNITRLNWILLVLLSGLSMSLSSSEMAKGIILGGIIVTVNFQLLSRTLKKSLTPPHLSSPSAVLFKYFIRFLISGIIIFFLIVGHMVAPVGLIIGLSIVVASIMLATMVELKKLIFKEAV